MDVPPLFSAETVVTDAVLNVIARTPTRSLSGIATAGFFATLSDEQVMRMAVLLARQSWEEGGCPIGAVIVDKTTRQIIGKGHNTLVQDDDPYNHGETSAIRDAGRVDFSQTTIFSTLSPCNICATLIYMRGFERAVVGDVTNASGTEDMMRSKGVQVDVLEDSEGIALYAEYRAKEPALDLEDWQGVAALDHTPVD